MNSELEGALADILKCLAPDSIYRLTPRIYKETEGASVSCKALMFEEPAGSYVNCDSIRLSSAIAHGWAVLNRARTAPITEETTA